MLNKSCFEKMPEIVFFSYSPLRSTSLIFGSSTPPKRSFNLTQPYLPIRTFSAVSIEGVADPRITLAFNSRAK